MHFGFGGFGGLGMVIFWISIVVMLIVFIRLLIDSFSKRESTSRAPLEILKERYAAGEITREEFEEKKHDLVKK